MDEIRTIRSKWTDLIYEIPCPHCRGKLRHEETMSHLVDEDIQRLWEICNQYTLVFCDNGCKVTFEEIFPMPAYVLALIKVSSSPVTRKMNNINWPDPE